MSKGAARVAVDRNGDLIQADVGGTELGVVVVASAAEAVGDLPGLLKVGVGAVRVVPAGGNDRALQGQGAVQGHGLRITAVGFRPQGVGSSPGGFLGLVVVAGADENEHQPEGPGGYQHRAACSLGGGHGTVGGDPGGFGFTELVQGGQQAW